MMEIVHERRDTNFNTHTLARSTLFNSTDRYVWFSDPSDGMGNSFILNI